MADVKMNSRNNRLGKAISGLSQREKVILVLLAALVVVLAVDFLFSSLILDRSRILKEDVATAEKLRSHQQRLLSRQELIETEYEKLENPVTTTQDTVMTETEILRKLSGLADRRVLLQSVVPRLNYHEGRQALFVSLDVEGPFEPVLEYLKRILKEMPIEISGMSLAPRIGEIEGVVCRISIRVEYFES